MLLSLLFIVQFLITDPGRLTIKSKLHTDLMRLAKVIAFDHHLERITIKAIGLGVALVDAIDSFRPTLICFLTSFLAFLLLYRWGDSSRAFEISP